MEIKIVDKKEEPLLARTEFSALIAFDAVTPARNDVRKALADSLKLSSDLVVVRAIKTRYGSKAAHVFAYAYKTLDDLNRFESGVILARHAPKKQKEAAA